MLCRTLNAAPSGKTPGDPADWLRWLDIFKRLFRNKIVGMEQSVPVPKVRWQEISFETDLRLKKCAARS